MAANAFNKNLVRVSGSTFTVFAYKNQPIAFAQQVSHTSAQPVAPATPIQPLDEPYPLQIITPAAAGMGSLTLNLYELYYAKIWEQLGSQGPKNLFGSGRANTNRGFFAGDNDIVDVFIRQAAEDPAHLKVVKYIRPPALAGSGVAGTSSPSYWEMYHNCVITNIVDGEEINIGSMEVVKQITLGYTRVTRQDAPNSLAIQLRNNAVAVAPEGGGITL